MDENEIRMQHLMNTIEFGKAKLELLHKIIADFSWSDLTPQQSQLITELFKEEK